MLNTAYIGITGRAAGPIQIGPSGVWLNTTTAPQAATPGVLTCYSALNGHLAQLRAAYPNTSDANSVATVGFVWNAIEGKVSESAKESFADYVKTERFDYLYNAVLGHNGNYDNSNPSIQNRIDTIESTVKSYNNSIQLIEKEVTAIGGKVELVETNIRALDERIDSLVYDPFGEPVLLIAGTATSV